MGRRLPDLLGREGSSPAVEALGPEPQVFVAGSRPAHNRDFARRRAAAWLPFNGFASAAVIAAHLSVAQGDRPHVVALNAD